MKTKRRTNLNYLLIGMAVALAAYLVSEWDGAVRGFNEGFNGSSHNSGKTK